MEWARQYKPGGTTLNRDDRLHLRWVCHWPDGEQKYYTKAWSDTLSPREALKACLKSVWAEYERLKYGKCWFNIDALPVEQKL